MSFVDPQKVKIGATEHELPRVSVGKRESEYVKNDGSVDMLINTKETNRGRKRHVARVDQTKVVASTLVPTTNERVSASVSLVIDRPVEGFTNAEAKELVDGLIANLQASTSANIVKLIAGES